MRSALWVTLTVLFVVVVAAGYVLLQPKGSAVVTVTDIVKKTIPAAPTSMPTTQPNGAPGNGDGVWIKVPDEKTGALAWQFRASHYDPQPDNSVNCTDPRAQFFFNNGQIIDIDGKTGHVFMPGNAFAAQSGGTQRGGGGMPSRGELYNVLVTMREAANPSHVAMRFRTNNVSFDNDLFRIQTEAYSDENGKVISRDQVPVTVRGDDYDFDGRGLIIRWNDRDRHLQLLEVEHGQDLVIKNQQMLNQSGSSTKPSSTSKPTSKPATRPARPATPARGRGRGRPAAATQPEADVAIVGISTTQPATKPATTQPIYHAVFDGGASGVRITQAGKQIALAETMTVDFASKEQDDSSSSNPPQQTERPTSRRASAATSPTTSRAATSRSATAAAAPAGPPPIIVRWPNKLVVTPIEEDAPKLAPGEMTLFLESAKRQTLLDYTGWNVICASCNYIDSGKGAELRSSPVVPLVVVKDSSGATLWTPKLDYDQTAGHAVMTGKSHALIPVAANGSPTTAPSTRPGDMLAASWSDSCVLTLEGHQQSDMTIKLADIIGQVHVDHPKLKMDSDTMRIAFAPPVDGGSKNSQVQQLDSDGSVKTIMLDEQQMKRHVDSDHLTVVMAPNSATGELKPHLVTATGNVHSYDEQNTQQLRSGTLVATLAPTTQPGDAPHLEQLVAQENVTFASGDSSGASDQLTAVANGDDYDVHLTGSPTAMVKSKDETVTGAIINMQPKKQTFVVVGAGTMSGMQQASAGEKATPFTMTWQRGLQYDGSTNHAHADDHIVFNSVSSDGAKNHGVGDELNLDLMDDPNATTQPTPTTQSSDPLSGGFGGTSKKAIKLLTLNGNAQVASILNDPAGNLARRMNLFASQVQVAGNNHVIVPVPGRMLFEDTRGSTTQPTTQSSAKPAPTTAPLGGMNGATAFSWQKRLDYDQGASQAKMTGNVVIVHQGNGAADSFRLESEQVTTNLEKDDKSTSQPVDPSAGTMSKIKNLVAEQDVHFASKQAQFDADQITFDPATNILIARGTNRVPVRLYDEKGTTGGQFGEIWYDTKSGQITRLIDANGTIHR